MDTPFYDYIVKNFAKEDEVLTWIQAEADRHNMPHISLRPDEARLLQIFAHSIQARKVVEIGTLAGYSGVWLARALPSGGHLYTLEHEALHAQVAAASFERAGVTDRVTLLQGEALASLDQLAAQAPFDMVFMDADRANYVNYLQWVEANLRVGGILAVHNAFTNGNILDPKEDGDRGMLAFQQALLQNSHFESTIVGVGDGMIIAVKQA